MDIEEIKKIILDDHKRQEEKFKNKKIRYKDTLINGHYYNLNLEGKVIRISPIF